MGGVGHGINRVGLRTEPNPAGAADKFFRAETDAFAVSKGHHFRDFDLHFRGDLGRQFFFLDVILLEESAVIEDHEQFRFALNNDGEVGMRNEQVLADMQHRAAHIVHPHNQLRRRLQFPRNLSQHVSGLYDVLNFFRRRMTR